MRLGDTVVIQGAGGLEDNAAAVARTAGRAVIVIDKIAGRLDVAADFGATHCIDASAISAAEVSEQVRKHTDGVGADWVIEVVGVPDARRHCGGNRVPARGCPRSLQPVRDLYLRKAAGVTVSVCRWFKDDDLGAPAVQVLCSPHGRTLLRVYLGPVDL